MFFFHASFTLIVGNDIMLSWRNYELVPACVSTLRRLSLLNGFHIYFVLCCTYLKTRFCVI